MVEATFANFVEFIEEWCQTLSDPVYARGGLKDKNEKLKVCLTEVGEKNKENDKNKVEIKCPLCATPHDLDDCVIFKDKTAREKKDFLFKAKMCFSCYSKNHLAEKCDSKRTCQTCGGGHPTGLHEVKFKVSAVKQGRGKICIVPVRLRHKTWVDKEIEVYAMLDECSEGIFISESVFDMLEDEIKRRETVILNTLNHSSVDEVGAVKGL